MLKYLIGFLVFASTVNASDFNGGKKYSEMTAEEKKQSMHRLKMLNMAETADVLREGGFKTIKEYNMKMNPSFDQHFNATYNQWKKLFPRKSPYKYNAWVGSW